MHQYFKLDYNKDSSNYSLLVIDPDSKEVIFEYDYAANNPLLNLPGDKYDKDYHRRRMKDFKLSFKSETPPQKRDSTILHENAMLSRSRYNIKTFQYDTLHPPFKQLISDLDFDYCTDFLNISTFRNTIPINRNTLIAILTPRINLETIHYTIVQNRFIIGSCNNRQIKRRLDIIKSNGQLFSITERYKNNESPKFTYNNVFGINRNDFDIVELDSQLIFITYVEKKIKIYDLYTEQLIIEFDTKRHPPYKYKAIKISDHGIAFIPKPVRIGGYDMKKHMGFKGNGIDFSRLKDYDDTEKRMLVIDFSENAIYGKTYRIDRIEMIERFDGYNVVFSDGEVESVKKDYELEE